MKTKQLFLALVVCLTVWPALAEPRIRPADWAQPVIGSSLRNLYRVSPELFRSEQPTSAAVADLKALGVRSIVNLREYHDDLGLKTMDGIVLSRVEMEASSVKREEVLEALRQIQNSPKPVLVHCWHGSDRTGVVVAAYRIVFQKWSNAQAIDEFKNGGYGFHEGMFGNLLTLLEGLDGAAMRKELGLP